MDGGVDVRWDQEARGTASVVREGWPRSIQLASNVRGNTNGRECGWPGMGGW